VNITRIDEGDVYKGDELAGHLERRADDIVFRYDAVYLESNLPAVATSLPKSPHVVRTTGGAVPPFFAGLLPEGRRLTALQRGLKTSADDEFSQLLAVGRDCIGDVRIFPRGAAVDSAPAFARAIGEPGEVSFVELFDSEVGERIGRGRSIPGVQDKLSDSMLSLPVRHRGEAVILKLSPPAIPRLVENEAFFLGLAARSGLDVPRFSVVHDRNGVSGLVVNRFDRHNDKGYLTRIAQEDAVQLAARWPSAKYQMSTREVFEVVTSVSAAVPVALTRLLRLFAFSYLIANGDLHGKNVSVYYRNDSWSVTPAYDLVTTAPYGDLRMALDLDGRDMEIRGSMFVAFVGRFGISEKVARRILNELADAVEASIDELGDIGFDDRRTIALEKTIRARIEDVRA
jgi:serine/threonine-protein kinase HipA